MVITLGNVRYKEDCFVVFRNNDKKGEMDKNNHDDSVWFTVHQKVLNDENSIK